MKFLGPCTRNRPNSAFWFGRFRPLNHDSLFSVSSTVKRRVVSFRTDREFTSCAPLLFLLVNVPRGL